MEINAQLIKIAARIIKEQEGIIGPLAWDEARKVQGIEVVDQRRGDVNLNFQVALGSDIINKLVAQYERLFGKASHAVCREAVQDLIAEMPPQEIPNSLK
jgi:hypothetical protein